MVMEMKDYLEIPLNNLCGITYTNPDREIDSLEWSFIEEISKHTGFFLSRIHIKKAYKCKYSRKIDGFEFEYEGKNYVLEKGKIKDLA